MKCLLLLSTLAGLAIPASSPAATIPAKPNIIVFYADDFGYADLGCQGVVKDIRTPNIDAIAKNGVRMLNGYSTAPQCVPSRAGMISGRYQNRFGVEANPGDFTEFKTITTSPQRMQAAGYVTAMFGKWHLGPESDIATHGFTHTFPFAFNHSCTSNITMDGKDRPTGKLDCGDTYHIDACGQAAVSLIERYKDKPFFFYVAFRAPHVPLDAPKKYLDRFPGAMPDQRREALGMISAVDDNVGLITAKLKELNLTEKTLVFFMADNGAPLKVTKRAGWDGSLNDPLRGEKGMLTEGGMHEPFVACWPGTIPPGQVYAQPVISLDIGATAVALAGVSVKPGELDGVNLIPFLTGANKAAPHDSLYWRWCGQAAIREGDWKLLHAGKREYLFNLKADVEENHNLLAQHPEIAKRLRDKLTAWSMELHPPGLDNAALSMAAQHYYDYYLDGKPYLPVEKQGKKGKAAGGDGDSE